jgi:hypothetical protein
MTETWVRTYDNGTDYIESLNGISWGDGALPRRWHRCRAQTRGWMNLDYVERCNCGATRLSPSGPWIHKNETRDSRERQKREDAKPRVTVICGTCGKPYEAAQGSQQAAERLCMTCWGEAFVASGGSRP